MLLLKNIPSFKLSPLSIGALFVLFIYNYHCLCAAHNQDLFFSNIENNSISTKNYIHNSQYWPNPLKKIFKQTRNRHLAAALAFPFPFGCVGLHRVYLGTAAHVPIVYAASAGGVFGLIPLIDCIVLLSQKNISDYENNAQVIMWIKH
ncbi:MAG: hypothetical protein KatS3mg027_1042 [Bacteroidia bacterium]|nr:MAG: hypothetical protein KatS3mg027_1042 [Bacteroidia bacterium]